MIPPDIIQFVRQEIARAANVILTAKARNATQAVEDIEAMFVNMTTIEKRPVMHPYGFASRAKGGTMSVVARQGESLSNRVVLGHRDAERPELEAEGEVMLYNSHGEQLYLKSGTVIVKSEAVHLVQENPSDHAARASLTKQQLQAIIDYLKTHTHPTGVGPSGAPTTPPVDAQDVKSTKVLLE